MVANARHLPETPVLYSFRRCPYAMRARLGIVASGLIVELREILLRDKPEHMLNLSPKGTVPVLWLCDGTVIDESLDVMLWALQQSDPLGWLDLNEQQTRQTDDLVAQLDGPFKHHLDRYKYANRYEDCDALTHRQACVDILRTWDGLIASNGGWLVDQRERFVDYALLPFVRQFRVADETFFDEEPTLGALRQWLFNYLESPKFRAIMPKLKPWQPGDAAVLFPA